MKLTKVSSLKVCMISQRKYDKIKGNALLCNQYRKKKWEIHGEISILMVKIRKEKFKVMEWVGGKEGLLFLLNRIHSS